MKALSAEANQAIDAYVDQLKKSGPDKYLFQGGLKQNDLSLNLFDHGDALYLGKTRILSASFQYALVEKLQHAFIDTHPSKMPGIFGSVYMMTCANSRGGLNWVIDNTMISDPDRKYAELAANAAMHWKGKNSRIENSLWFSFLRQEPSAVQFNKYRSDILQCVSQEIKIPNINEKSAEQYIDKHGEDNPLLYRFLDTVFSYSFIEENLSANEAATTHNWYDEVKNKYPSFYAEKEKEKEILYRQFGNSITLEIEKPTPTILQSYPETSESDEAIIQNSRDILLSSPIESQKMILQKVQVTPESKKFIIEKLSPILCARAEFLAEMKGNFVYHAMHHFYNARYYERQAFFDADDDTLGISKRRESVLYHIYQSSIECGEKCIDQDIVTIKAQTQLLKLAS